jgi:RHS repeat-associated protein
VTNSGLAVNMFAYSYDLAGNRLSEQMGGTNNTATYNALNQTATTTAPGTARTNEWDAAHRLTAVNAGNQRTEFTYDGLSRLTGIRKLINGTEVCHRMFVWNGGRLREEHDTNGAVTKRFFPEGVQIVSGSNAGSYYYARDHLGSIRELTDTNGNVRARYAYDPFGRRTKVSGDVDADFGFAGMFWSSEVNLAMARFRAYDPSLGRWLSRDPLKHAEVREGPNLYAYVSNQPVSASDRSGLGVTSTVDGFCEKNPEGCALLVTAMAGGAAQEAEETLPGVEPWAADTIETAAHCVGELIEPALPHIDSAVQETLSTVIEESDIIEESAFDIGDRLADLAQQYLNLGPDLMDEFNAWLEARASLGPQFNNIPIWTPNMIALEYQFTTLYEALTRTGVDAATAWKAIAAGAGFDPNTWE